MLFVVRRTGRRMDQWNMPSIRSADVVKGWSKIRDLETMKTIVKEIIDNNINSMGKTFVHCGFT